MSIRVVYINLDESTKRRAYMEQQFLEHGIKAERFSAIKYEEGKFFTETPYPNPIGEKGCLLSHLNVATSAEEVTLVLEDDTDLSLMRNWQFTLEELVEALPEGWDVVQLFRQPNFLPIQLEKKSKYFFREGGFSCGAYLVHPNYAKALRERFFLGELVNTQELNKLISHIAEFVIYSSDNAYTTSVLSVKQFNSTVLPGRPDNDMSSIAQSVKEYWGSTPIHLSDIVTLNTPS